jgi:hypothetical protein
VRVALGLQLRLIYTSEPSSDEENQGECFGVKFTFHEDITFTFMSNLSYI